MTCLVQRCGEPSKFDVPLRLCDWLVAVPPSIELVDEAAPGPAAKLATEAIEAEAELPTEFECELELGFEFEFELQQPAASTLSR